MLVLSRKENGRVYLGDNIVVTVVQIRGDQVRLGFEAPADVNIVREEVRNSEMRVYPKEETR